MSKDVKGRLGMSKDAKYALKKVYMGQEILRCPSLPTKSDTF